MARRPQQTRRTRLRDQAQGEAGTAQEAGAALGRGSVGPRVLERKLPVEERWRRIEEERFRLGESLVAAGTRRELGRRKESKKVAEAWAAEVEVLKRLGPGPASGRRAASAGVEGGRAAPAGPGDLPRRDRNPGAGGPREVAGNRASQVGVEEPAADQPVRDQGRPRPSAWLAGLAGDRASSGDRESGGILGLVRGICADHRVGDGMAGFAEKSDDERLVVGPVMPRQRTPRPVRRQHFGLTIRPSRSAED